VFFVGGQNANISLVKAVTEYPLRGGGSGASVSFGLRRLRKGLRKGLRNDGSR